MNKIYAIVHCTWESDADNLPVEIKLPIQVPEGEDTLAWLNDFNVGEAVERQLDKELYDCSWEYVIPANVISNLVDQ